MVAQMDDKGYFHTAKVFPCECGTEGAMVTIEEDDEFFDMEGAPFICLSFWEMTSKFNSRVGFTRWEKIKYAWGILRGKSPWTDMVWMRAATAKNLAHHILYLISKAKSREKERKEEPIFDRPKNKIVKEPEFTQYDPEENKCPGEE